jgi:hypothetical protein
LATLNKPSAQLLGLNDMNLFAYFLLDGCLHLQLEQGEGRRMQAGELNAGFPVAHLRPSHYQVTAENSARLIRIEASKLRTSTGKPRQVRFAVTDESIGGLFRHLVIVAQLHSLVRQREF